MSICSQNFDFRITKTISGLETYSFSRVVSKGDEFLCLAIPAGLIGYGLIVSDNNTLYKGISTGLAIGTSAAIVYGGKNIIKRQRPFVSYPDNIFNHAGKKTGGYSFPSGHTSTAFALATALTLSYPKWYVVAPSYLLATSVTYSRINLGVHYLSDVFAGAALGAGFAYLAHISANYLQKRYGKTETTTMSVLPVGCCLVAVIPF